MKKIWKLLGNMNLSIGILSLLVCDLIAGYYNLKGNESIFKPMNDLGLIEWAGTFGRTYPAKTIWFFILLILLTLLVINTFVCTTDKMIILIKNRRHFKNPLNFILKFSPHIIHYALIIIMGGYFITYLYPAICTDKIIVLKQSVNIPGTNIKMMLNTMNIDYYHGTRLNFLNGRAYDISADLLLSLYPKPTGDKTSGKKHTENTENTKCKNYNEKNNSIYKCIKKTIGLNRPFLFDDMSFHLKDFAPKYQYGMKRQPYICLSIKKSFGIKVYFAGTLLLLSGLLMYLYQWFSFKKTGH